MSWRCKNCGCCCRFIVIDFGEASQDEIKWASAHKMLYYEKHLVIPAKCKYLVHKQGLYYCSIWERRPEICRKAGEKECKSARENCKEYKKWLKN